MIPVLGHAATAVLEPREAAFVISEGETPPQIDATRWETRRLPDDWNDSQPNVGGNGWYRFAIALDAAPERPWAVHLHRLRMNAAVFVNGVFVGDGGRFTEPMSRNWNRPLYFVVPVGLLRGGENTVDVRVVDPANVHAGLYGLEIGPHQALEAGYRWRFFLKVDVIQACMVITVAMGLFLATLWFRWRRDSAYGWFAATMILWSGNSTTSSCAICRCRRGPGNGSRRSAPMRSPCCSRSRCIACSGFAARGRKRRWARTSPSTRSRCRSSRSSG